MPPFIADHPMLCAVALIFIDIAVWRLISANLANWKLAARLAIFAVFSAVLFNDGMNPHANCAVYQRHRLAPGRHGVADRLVAVRGAHAHGIARHDNDAAGRAYRSVVAGFDGRGDFPDCDHRCHGLCARLAGQGGSCHLRRGGDHCRPGLAKHPERCVFRDRPQHHQALSNR